jgi:hypothetical protein
LCSTLTSVGVVEDGSLPKPSTLCLVGGHPCNRVTARRAVSLRLSNYPLGYPILLPDRGTTSHPPKWSTLRKWTTCRACPTVEQRPSRTASSLNASCTNGRTSCPPTAGAAVESCWREEGKVRKGRERQTDTDRTLFRHEQLYYFLILSFHLILIPYCKNR